MQFPGRCTAPPHSARRAAGDTEFSAQETGGAAGSRPEVLPAYNDRPMTSFMISDVPPYIRETRASRHNRAIGYSFM
jgi:hypothetical protein